MKTDVKVSKKRRVKEPALTEKQLEALANAEVDRNLDDLSKIVDPGSMDMLHKTFIKAFKDNYRRQGGKIIPTRKMK